MRTSHSVLTSIHLQDTDPPAPRQRCRPLHTCAASVLAVLHNAAIKAQDFGDPLGSIARRGIRFLDSSFPFVYTVLYQWLAVLSFMDDHILRAERKMETVFPASGRVFDKIDVLVCNVELLPENVDDLVRKASLIMRHHIPFLDRINVVFGKVLNVLGSRNGVTREKEIREDVCCTSVIPQSGSETAEIAVHSLPEKPINEAKNVSDSKYFQEDERRVQRFEWVEDMNSDVEESPLYKSAGSSPLSDHALHEHDESGVLGTGVIRKSNSMKKFTYKEMLEKATEEG